MKCEKENLVHAYHDRQLGPSARADFESHLAECTACAESLRDLQAISRTIQSTSLPEISETSVQRYRDAWNRANQRNILRISTWLTGAAAAALVASLLLFPAQRNPEPAAVSARPSNWELVAMMPPSERITDRPDEFVELAQWMADDLSTTSR